MAFWSDDVFATAKILKSKGVEFEVEPKIEVWGTTSIFRDIDGNKFVLSSKSGETRAEISSAEQRRTGSTE